MRVVALADHALCAWHVERVGERRAASALDAVVRPEHLMPVGQLYGRKRHLATVRRRKRDVTGGMPVLRQQHVVEPGRDPVDDRDDFITPIDGERPARQEVVLDVNDQQDGVTAHQPTALPISSTTFLASPNTIIVFGM